MTKFEIAESTVAHADALKSDDWAAVAAASALPFRDHLGAIIDALPTPLRSVDIKHLWQSGAEWHVETECVGEAGTRTLLLRYRDGKIVGGAIRPG